MATNKRAAMRREKRVREKLTQGKQTDQKLMARAFIAGKNEGFETASGIIFLALCEEFGFGAKRIERLMNRISNESLKMDEDATKFNVDYYIQRLHEKCGIEIIKNEYEVISVKR